MGHLKRLFKYFLLNNIKEGKSSGELSASILSSEDKGEVSYSGSWYPYRNY